jgi:hypothetical protein
MKLKNILVVCGVCLAVWWVGYYALLRPWFLHWGASPDEVGMTLPGDEINPGVHGGATRAITIHAPAAQVWPWLVQLGQGRGGLYSYEDLENLFGCQMHNVESILPELQDLAVGDVVRLGPAEGFTEQLPFYTVVDLQPGRALVLRATDPLSGELLDGVWAFILLPAEDGSTRLVIRSRNAAVEPPAEAVINRMVEPVHFLMEHKMMDTLRRLAEGA